MKHIETYLFSQFILYLLNISHREEKNFQRYEEAVSRDTIEEKRKDMMKVIDEFI